MPTSKDPDQMLFANPSASHKHDCAVKSFCSNFRIITVIFWRPNFLDFYGSLKYDE